eukprot:CAMPEP_0119293472 /NCGR_PEP_ID=MMETSP1329-20130426/46160_1 /TAXON_ID=114041 /ORGANISM="Genus nov. species nov., Strain RCC1024" /LENGTH=219 /DNA_ID=CAMNT_0007294343 /DNA_START=184 /DNA_END=840 /DNA_ORIENTATION=+
MKITFILCALLAPTVAGDAVEDRLNAMTIKQLRWLLRDLGALDELPRGPVEKAEVIALAAPIVREEEKRKRAKRNSAWGWSAAYYGGLAAVVFFFWEPIAMATVAWRHQFVDEASQLWSLADYAARAGSPSAAILVFLTGCIDLATYYLRLSVLISWVAPRNSMIRKLLVPLPTLAVDPAMAMGTTSGFNINVAPMCMTWGLGWLKTRVSRAVGRRMAA